MPEALTKGYHFTNFENTQPKPFAVCQDKFRQKAKNGKVTLVV